LKENIVPEKYIFLLQGLRIFHFAKEEKTEQLTIPLTKLFYGFVAGRLMKNMKQVITS
jgi:hypothetical protein